jgi:hypothetical protein
VGPQQELRDAERRYEQAEAAFLAAVRTGRSRAVLSSLAEDVAAHATAWNTATQEAFAPPSDSGAAHVYDPAATERAAVLEYLWVDISNAFHGLPRRLDT